VAFGRGAAQFTAVFGRRLVELAGLQHVKVDFRRCFGARKTGDIRINYSSNERFRDLSTDTVLIPSLYLRNLRTQSL